MALFSLSSSQQLRDLLRQNNVAYSSDDLLIIYQAPLESRSPGAQMKNSRQHVLTRSWAMCYWQLYKSFQESGFKPEGEFAVQHAFFHLFYSHYMGKEGILSSIQKRQTEAQSVNDGELQCRAYETSGLLTLLIISLLVGIFHHCFVAKKLLIKTHKSLGFVPFVCVGLTNPKFLVQCLAPKRDSKNICWMNEAKFPRSQEGTLPMICNEHSPVSIHYDFQERSLPESLRECCWAQTQSNCNPFQEAALGFLVDPKMVPENCSFCPLCSPFTTYLEGWAQLQP